MEHNATAVRYVRNVNGATPTNPAFRQQRITDSTLDAATRTDENDELRTDLQKQGVTPIGEEAGGGWNYRLSFDSLNDAAQAVFGSEWAYAPTRQNTVAGDVISAVGAGTGFTFATSAGTIVNVGTFAPGMLVRSTGFLNSANNAVFVAPAGTTATALPYAGSVAEATPPTTARLKAVGFQGGAGAISAAGVFGGAIGTNDEPRLVSDGSIDFTTLGVSAGEQVMIGNKRGTSTFRFGAGAAVGPQNGAAVVRTISATEIRLAEVSAGWVADTGAGKTIRVFVGDWLRNGSTPIDGTIEEEFADLPEWRYYHNMVGQNVSLTLAQGAPITGTATFQGAYRDDPVVTRMAGATTVPAPSGVTLNAANRLGSVRVGGTELGGTHVSAMDLTLARETQQRGALFSSGGTTPRFGDFVVTGTFTRYYRAGTGAILAQTRAGTPVSISLLVPDEAGARAMGFTIPSAQYTTAPRRNDNGTRVLNPGFRGNGDNALGYSAQYTRFEYVEF